MTVKELRKQLRKLKGNQEIFIGCGVYDKDGNGIPIDNIFVPFCVTKNGVIDDNGICSPSILAMSEGVENERPDV